MDNFWKQVLNKKKDKILIQRLGKNKLVFEKIKKKSNLNFKLVLL